MTQKEREKLRKEEGYRWAHTAIDVLTKLAVSGDREAEQTLRELARRLETMFPPKEPKSTNCEPSNLQNAKPVNCETSKGKDSQTTKAERSRKPDLLEHWNLIIAGMEILYDAALQGSTDAEKFFHDQAELFIQKAGDLS